MKPLNGSILNHNNSLIHTKYTFIVIEWNSSNCMTTVLCAFTHLLIKVFWYLLTTTGYWKSQQLKWIYAHVPNGVLFFFKFFINICCYGKLRLTYTHTYTDTQIWEMRDETRKRKIAMVLWAKNTWTVINRAQINLNENRTHTKKNVTANHQIC